MPADTNRIRVWDLPVRIFHWLLAGSFLLAWTLAVTADDESRAFAVHALLGLFIAALVAFRVVWGAIGTRYARFSGFANRPRALAAYLKGIVVGPEPAFVGHNPASSYATYAMLALLSGLVATGVLMGRGYGSVEELHELLAHAMLALVGIHVLGVILYGLRHRDAIVRGMLDGRKRGAPTAGIRSVRPVSALVLSVLLASWAGGLWRGFDPSAQRVTLPVLGTTLALGESEGEGEGEEHGPGGRGQNEEGEEEDDD